MDNVKERQKYKYKIQATRSDANLVTLLDGEMETAEKQESK